MPYWATIPVAGVVCLVVGFLFGLPALRLEGLYLALATFALGVAMPQILKYGFEHWTGGVAGHRASSSPKPPCGCRSPQDQWLYFFTLAWAVVLFVARLEPAARPHRAGACRDPRPADRRRRRWASTPRSTSRSPSASARSTPASPARSARSWSQFVAPDSFDVFLSLTLLVGIVIGGLASISGGDLRRALHPVRAEHRRRDLQGRALGDLRRVPDRLHVRDAARRRRIHARWSGCRLRQFRALSSSDRRASPGPGASECADEREEAP